MKRYCPVHNRKLGSVATYEGGEKAVGYCIKCEMWYCWDVKPWADKIPNDLKTKEALK